MGELMDTVRSQRYGASLRKQVKKVRLCVQRKLYLRSTHSMTS